MSFSEIREWINSGPARYIAIAVALTGVGAGAFWVLRDGGDAERQAMVARGRKVVYVCKECGANGTLSGVAYDAPFPLPCPQCGKAGGMPAVRCYKCRTLFASEEKSVFSCPNCGAEYFTIPGMANRKR